MQLQICATLVVKNRPYDDFKDLFFSFTDPCKVFWIPIYSVKSVMSLEIWNVLIFCLKTIFIHTHTQKKSFNYRNYFVTISILKKSLLFRKTSKKKKKILKIHFFNSHSPREIFYVEVFLCLYISKMYNIISHKISGNVDLYLNSLLKWVLKYQSFKVSQGL